MLNEAVRKVYNQECDVGRETIGNNLSFRYERVKSKLAEVYGNDAAFFYAIRVCGAIFAADGTTTEQEYEIFKKASGCGPTYREFCDTTNGISKDYYGVIDLVGKNLTLAMATTMLAIDLYIYRGGELSSEEEAFLNALYDSVR